MFLTALRKNKGAVPPLLIKTWMIMRLSFILLLAGSMHLYAKGVAQQVSLEAKNTSLEKIFTEIRKQTGRNFLYSNDDLSLAGKLDVSVANKPLSEALAAILKNTPLSFRMVDGVVVIKRKEEINYVVAPPPVVTISGKVVNEKGEPVMGASIVVEGTKNGTVTNKLGVFTLRVNKAPVTLVVISLGYKRKALENVKGEDLVNVVLEPELEKLEEVVVSNGMYTRKAGTFTGTTSTFNQAQIKEVTNQNVLAALAILDPSFQVLQNNAMGSNPNSLPEIQIRGQNGFAEDLRTEYSNIANQPLFILDGFETSLQKIFDLNINFIRRITILKDAAAKAMWGAKAGNGVVVIETIRPTAGKLRLSYNGAANITAPDLSSYHLTNAMEKVEAEVLSGRYSSTYPDRQATLTKQYATNLKAAQDGVNTYWLAQGLQNGIGQRHSLMVDGGDDAVQYSVNLSYNKNAGVMKGSDRTTYSGQSVMMYRKGKISATNNLSIDRNSSRNSPYGSFSEYAKMNPYWRIYDDQGKLIPTYSVGSTSTTIGNPLYNATLNSKDGSDYTLITENFQLDYRHNNNVRFFARVGYTQQNNQTDFFRSAKHTDYLNISPTNAEYLNRGIYRITNGFQKGFTVDVSGSYNKVINRHELYFNGILTANQQNSSTTGMTMVGFPNDDLSNISMGRQYQTGSKAVGTENTVRIAAATAAFNYVYDNRFLADASYRRNGSSQYGKNTKWGDFWSLGAGWNLHNEALIKKMKWVDLFRATANTGVTGTPPGQNAYQSLATYSYITNTTYNGDLGLDLMALANPNLKWQKVQESNYGVQLGFFNRLTANFDYYIKNTHNLLLSMEVAPSLGFTDYSENIGDVRNQGFQASLSYRLIKDVSKGLNVNIFGNVAHNTNKIQRIASSLELMNSLKDQTYSDQTYAPAGTEEYERKRVPARRYEVGRSMSALWAVPSLGIDPSNGKEIFVKNDGTLTYVWDADDQTVMGDSQPLYNGTFGSNVQYGNLGINFAFTYHWGGQMYNSTLVSLVDNADYNYNVDIRALEQRWKKPGDRSSFKDIADASATRPTSRFVQDWSELVFSSVSLSYNFSRMNFIKRTPFKTLMFNCNMNDLGRLSTVRTERGLDYPYARTFSFSLTASF